MLGLHANLQWCQVAMTVIELLVLTMCCHCLFFLILVICLVINCFYLHDQMQGDSSIIHSYKLIQVLLKKITQILVLTMSSHSVCLLLLVLN